MNEEELKDKQQLEDYLETANDINTVYIKLNNVIRSAIPCDELPPIAIYYHNKIIEVYKIFKEKNVSYHDSLVNRSINKYILKYLIVEATYSLEKYARINLLIPYFFRDFMGKKLGEKYLEQYYDYCQQVMDFDIEKDVEKAINYDIETQMNDNLYAGGINYSIDKYNLELEQLGIDKTIEYQNDNLSFVLIGLNKNHLKTFKRTCEYFEKETNSNMHFIDITDEIDNEILKKSEEKRRTLHK